MNGRQCKNFEKNATEIIKVIDEREETLELIAKIQKFLAYLLQPREKKFEIGIEAYTNKLEEYAKV